MSERLIGDCLRRDVRPAFVASKFAPFVARAHHVKANLGALDWRLTDEELAILDAASASTK